MAPENWLYYFFFWWKDPADTIILLKVSPIFFRAFQSFASTKSFAIFNFVYVFITLPAALAAVSI